MLTRTSDPNFFRDESNSALINTNVSAYRLYKQRRDGDKTIASLNDDVNHLKSEVTELKKLIKELLEKNNG
jgi:hypothetical protein